MGIRSTRRACDLLDHSVEATVPEISQKGRNAAGAQHPRAAPDCQRTEAARPWDLIGKLQVGIGHRLRGVVSDDEVPKRQRLRSADHLC